MRRLVAGLAVALCSVGLLAPDATIATEDTPVPIGVPDRRISELGPAGNGDFESTKPRAVYNPSRDEIFVVWQGDHHLDGLSEGEFEIWGRRLASSGEPLAPAIRISSAGGTGSTFYFALVPDIAYDALRDEYVVTWSANDIGYGSFELEVFARRLRGSDGAPQGGAQRISSMGGGVGIDGFPAYVARVAYSAVQDEFLVAWYGMGTGLAVGETEIYGQRLEAGTLAEIGDDVRLSDLGGIGNGGFEVVDIAVAWCEDVDEYWIVFSGNDDSGSLHPGEVEVFLQRIDASNGQEIGFNDQRLSAQGGLGVAAYDALDVAIACGDGVALVVWSGDGGAGLADDELEIFGQIVDLATGLELGDDVRLSDVAGSGNASFDARRPGVAYDPARQTFFVTWAANDTDRQVAPADSEVFGQLVDLAGFEVGDNDFAVTSVGNADDFAYQPSPLLVGARPFVVFQESADYRAGRENEIAGQLLEYPLFTDGFESGDTDLWSDTSN